MNQKFGKRYKLCSKNIIDNLFKNGERLYLFPYSAVYQWCELPEKNVPFQVVISVPKRLFKHAHDRNKIKRLIREALRKNKYVLEEALVTQGKQMALFLVYTHRQAPTWSQLMRKTEKLIELFILKLHANRILQQGMNIYKEES